MATRYDHGGGAVETTLNSTITSGDTTLVLDDATGWPSGAANGEFWIAVGVIDPVSRQFTSNVEKIKVGSRTGTTLSSLTRGQDGTSAQAHSAGETIRHNWTAAEAHQASEHAGNTALDDHTQYHTAARHAAVSHTQAMMGADSVGAAQIIAGSVGSAELAADAVVAGKIATGAISAAGQFAAGVVDAAAIATDAVGTAEIAALAVGTAELANDAVTADKLATGAVAATADLADGIVTLAKLASEGGTSYTPSFGGLTGASNVTFGRSLKFGRLVVGWAGFVVGSGGNVTSEITVSLPYTSVNLPNALFLGGGRGFVQNGRYASIGFIQPNSATLRGFATAGTSPWDATVPANWDVDDNFYCFFAYEAAA